MKNTIPSVITFLIITLTAGCSSTKPELYEQVSISKLVRLTENYIGENVEIKGKITSEPQSHKKGEIIFVMAGQPGAIEVLADLKYDEQVISLMNKENTVICGKVISAGPIPATAVIQLESIRPAQ